MSHLLDKIARTEVIESARAGLGKTFTAIKQTKLELVYFPICGNIKFESLALRLKSIINIKQHFSLLIQIGHVQNKQKL